MPRRSTRALVVLLCLSMGVTFCIAQDDVATALYQEGLRKYILEDYTGALEDFESALKLDPESEKITKMYLNTLIKQGNREYETGNLREAEPYFSRAYRLSGEDEELRALLDSIRTQMKQEEERASQTIQAERPAQRPDERPISEGTEVQLPFDMESFIQQQNEENKKLLDEMLAAQRQEREAFLKNIEENQRILDENIETQRTERATLYANLEEGRKILDQSLEAQQEERNRLLKNIEENRDIVTENIAAQRQERETLLRNIEENQRIIDENIRTQQQERKLLLENIMEVSRNQSEDRKLFSRTLMILVGGSIFLALIIFFGFVLLLKRRTISQGKPVYYDAQAAIDVKPQTLLEYADRIDESKYLTDDRYSDMVQAKRLGHLYGELHEGNLSWETLQGYIGELNREVKSSILNTVEEKLKSGEVTGDRSVIDILLPFLTDGEADISARSRRLLTGIAGAAISASPEGEAEDTLSYNSLLQFARMADAKTGRPDHSVRVADIAEQMAAALDDAALDPDTVKRVGLAHDIGYLELDDSLLRKEGKLTERQFNIIKTHAECGLHLLQHVELPKIFSDGIKLHHERLDGSGYPKGLKGSSIPKIARLLAVADFFDAVTSARPHRPALTIGSGIKMMEQLAGEIFDQNMFNILVKLFKDQIEDET